MRTESTGIYRSSWTVIPRGRGEPTGVQEEQRRLIRSNSDTVQGGRDSTASQTGLTARKHGEDHKEVWKSWTMSNVVCKPWVWGALDVVVAGCWEIYSRCQSCAVGQSRRSSRLADLLRAPTTEAPRVLISFFCHDQLYQTILTNYLVI